MKQETAENEIPREKWLALSHFQKKKEIINFRRIFAHKIWTKQYNEIKWLFLTEGKGSPGPSSCKSFILSLYCHCSTSVFCKLMITE